MRFAHNTVSDDLCNDTVPKQTPHMNAPRKHATVHLVDEQYSNNSTVPVWRPSQGSRLPSLPDHWLHKPALKSPTLLSKVSETFLQDHSDRLLSNTTLRRFPKPHSAGYETAGQRVSGLIPRFGALFSNPYHSREVIVTVQRES